MIEKYTYGELAYFASSSNPPLNYFAVIGYENYLFLIYDNDEKLTISFLWNSVEKKPGNEYFCGVCRSVQ
jgi:hypothetical protein